MGSLLIAIGIVLLQGCSSIEEPESYYVSRQELIADNAVARGWVPPWLPASARTINEAHNIDTNEVWMRFGLDCAELEKVSACRQDNSAKLSRARGPRSKRATWWQRNEANDWAGYSCQWEQGGRARAAKIAISQGKGIALYWEEH